MPALPLERRDGTAPAATDDDTVFGMSFSPTTNALLSALLGLVLLGLLCIGALLVLRQVRRRRALRQSLHDHEHHPGSTLPATPGMKHQAAHRRLTITAAPFGRHSPPTHLPAGHGHGHGHGAGDAEKQGFLKSGPDSPVPEIRITFPEDGSSAHKGPSDRGSGRVVVVKIADSGAVGMAPYQEPAPPYSAAPRGGDRFQSLDMERMGGLREREDGKRWA